MSLSGAFHYVKIPADSSKPIKLLLADKKGGLTDDELVADAKAYFFQLTGAEARAAQISQASPEERKSIARQIRQQMGESATQLEHLDDDAVVDMIYRSQSQPTCEIAALTIPNATNGYQAVSMYSADEARQYQLPLNQRATDLMTACGHTTDGIFGDAFVGRAIDNEVDDIWQRTDFEVADADPGAEWCRVARSQGGGGGSGASAASSLSNLVQHHMKGGVQAIDGRSSTTNTLYGTNGAPPVVETWGTWTQTDEEVELRLLVASGTKAKYCKVNFGRTSLKVVVAGQTVLSGSTFDPVSVDDCTYTLEDEGDRRQLVITLGKADSGRTWASAVR